MIITRASSGANCMWIHGISSRHVSKKHVTLVLENKEHHHVYSEVKLLKEDTRVGSYREVAIWQPHAMHPP